VRPNIKIFRRAGFGGGREQNDTAAETRTPPKFDPTFFLAFFFFFFHFPPWRVIINFAHVRLYNITIIGRWRLHAHVRP
jgi:hypothetical protein